MEEVTDGLAISERPSYYHDGAYPSTDLADRFSGVAIPEGVSDEMRRSYINAYVEIYHMLERMGWYDHTGDWDFHIGIKLNDGRQEDHFGDGASVDFVRGNSSDIDDDEQKTYNGEDDRAFLRVEAPPFLDAETFTKLVPHAFDEFVSSRDSYTMVTFWDIPIELISEIGFGYCT